MAHFAKLDNDNIVLEVIVVNNDVLDPEDEEASGIVFLTEWSGGYTNWKQTSFNGTFRRNFAGINYFYDVVNDAFIAPQPYPSWILDDNFKWQAPKPLPNQGLWFWDESEGEWVESLS